MLFSAEDPFVLMYEEVASQILEVEPSRLQVLLERTPTGDVAVEVLLDGAPVPPMQGKLIDDTFRTMLNPPN
jgi:hypothetical protein